MTNLRYPILDSNVTREELEVRLYSIGASSNEHKDRVLIELGEQYAIRLMS